MKCMWKKLSCLALALTMALSCAGDAEGRVVNGTPARAVADTGMWEIMAYEDEFDMPTDKNFIHSAIIIGSFSNSVTTDSDLEAIVYCEESDGKSYINIRLLEYGKYRVKNDSSKARLYNAIIMGGDGKKMYFNSDGVGLTGLVIFGNDEGLYFLDDEEIQQIIDILKKGGTVRFAIIERDDPTTKYLFSFDATGFDVIYEQWRQGNLA